MTARLPPFLTAERFGLSLPPLHLAVRLQRDGLSPATMLTKLTHPDQRVVGVVGDGCFMMTAWRIVTASMNRLGAIFFVFHDGELAQISQFQSVPLKHKTCTVLGELRLDGVATATGATICGWATARIAGT